MMGARQFHVRQDGREFYVYDSPDRSRRIMRRTAPFEVTDVESAERARQWFIGSIERKTAQNLVWLQG